VQTSTSYGIRVAAASVDPSGASATGGSASQSGAAGAGPTALAGSAMAAVGVLGAALLL